jgi:alpha-beta hydrolase superfamily lysophospholipase
MNLHTDFDYQTIQLSPDYEGKVTATLISSKFNVGGRESVLYLHGYIDYFFHPHVCEKFINNDFDFYALDLRKYGRSILEHQRPNFCLDIEEYFEEITIAIRQINKTGNSLIHLLGHSTGGLIASNYMNYGKEKSSIKSLILNSPFLDFNQPDFAKITTYLTAKIASTILPYSYINGAMSPVYAQSIHKDYYGEWDFNLDWKPIKGFPTYFKWIVAISRAQKNLLNSNIEAPILVMHSSHSRSISTFSQEAMSSDIVLNIEDIKKIGSKLGKQVTLLDIDNALHDIFLSPKEIREEAFDEMFAWLRMGAPDTENPANAVSWSATIGQD